MAYDHSVSVNYDDIFVVFWNTQGTLQAIRDIARLRDLHSELDDDASMIDKYRRLVGADSAELRTGAWVENEYRILAGEQGPRDEYGWAQQFDREAE